MKKKMVAILLSSLMVISSLAVSGLTMAAEAGSAYTAEYLEADGFWRVTNPGGGPRLSYAPDTGVSLLEVSDGGFTYAFKDMDKDGELDPYEDWRLSPEERAEDLASRLSVPQIAGLMLFSNHTGPSPDGTVTEEQYNFLINDGVRAVLYARNQPIDKEVMWSNGMQKIVEANDLFAIPVNMSSDPRNSAQGTPEQSAANDTFGSGWPTNLALAATFNPDYAFLMGQIISEEYRALNVLSAPVYDGSGTYAMAEKK